MSENKKLTPLQEIKESEKALKRADRQRAEAKSVLVLGAVADLPPTLAEKALAQINLNIREGGQLTAADLRRFADKVEQLRRDYQNKGISGGIKPRSVIDRSRRADLRRCQDEINSVLAVRQQANGIITFRTNASGKYGAGHHIVTVQFLNVQAALNAGRLTKKVVDDVLKGAVKFDCDCGRHRFWYRYIATAGGFAYGTPETGFPKVRNPELTGLGCKHVLRVMHSLQSTALFRPMMTDYLRRYRKDANARQTTLTAKQAEKQLKKLGKKQIRRKKNTPDEEAAARAALEAAGASAWKKIELQYQSGSMSKEEFEYLNMMRRAFQAA